MSVTPKRGAPEDSLDHNTLMHHLLLFIHSLAPDSYDWSSQNNSFTAYVESEDSRLVPEELNPY